MLFWENVKLALSAIYSNKTRSFLTMLGVIIGISSVIAISSIGQGAKSIVDKEFSAYGSNNVYIYPKTNIESGPSDSDMLQLADLEALKSRFENEISYISPSVSEMIPVSVGRTKANFTVQGVAGDCNKYRPMEIIHGRMPTDSDVKKSRNFIVIPEGAAMRFFGRGDVVGEVIPVNISGNQSDMAVIGVYAVKKSIFSGLSGASSEDYIAYAPYTLFRDADKSTMIDMFVAQGYDVSEVCDQTTDYLELTKRKPEGFYFAESAEAQQSGINNILRGLSMAIAAIAAISLLVGGVGIMNIMLVSVTERTKEIGIRKSLGAKTGDVLLQFLIESMIVSAMGGLIGALLGIGIAGVGLSFAGVHLAVDFKIIALAVGFSAAVGMFFGMYPAKRAAGLDPIQALRYE
jgi:putative ABC transport system permease protein